MQDTKLRNKTNKKPAKQPQDFAFQMEQEIPYQQPFENIKIYKFSLALLSNITQVQARMPKNFKYGLGKDLSAICCNIQFCVIKTYEDSSPCNKIKWLRSCLDNISLLIVWLRVANNINGLSKQNYINCLSLVVEIKKQVNYWLDSLVNKKSEQRTENSDNNKAEPTTTVIL